MFIGTPCRKTLVDKVGLGKKKHFKKIKRKIQLLEKNGEKVAVGKGKQKKDVAWKKKHREKEVVKKREMENKKNKV